MQYHNETTVTYEKPNIQSYYIQKGKYKNGRKRYLLAIGESNINYHKSFYLFVTPSELREIIKDNINNGFSILQVSNI